jgi:hypothetical protein
MGADAFRGHDGGIPIAGFGAAGKKLDGEHAGEGHADEAGGEPDQELVPGDVAIPAAPAGQRFLVWFEDAADVRQRNAASADHAGNGPDGVAHPPALIADVVAHRRIGEAAITGDGSETADEGDEGEVELGPAATVR